MSDSHVPLVRDVSRITCHVSRTITPRITKRLARIGVDNALIESGRTVRHVLSRRPLGLPGTVDRLEDTPADVFHMTVPLDAETAVMEELVHVAKLDVPGYGSIYSQRIQEYGSARLPDIRSEDGTRRLQRRFLPDLALITIIVSMPEITSRLVRVALELGSSVPLITVGVGTGVRDRLGLLRITIPPEKEIVHLLVPQHDANEIMRLLVEEGRLDRHGRGFIYRAPVTAGMLDTRLHVGPPRHAASMEQVIAAIDELRRGTSWRKRFTAPESTLQTWTGELHLANREIVVICAEGCARHLVDAALDAGAGGATTTRLRRLSTGDGEGAAARERSIISVPQERADGVVQALVDAGATGGNSFERIQLLNAPASQF
jgi:hypothetical protein